MGKYKVASIDIETLGLDARNCNIIEFGCVLDDYKTPLDQLPRFRRLLYPYNFVFKGEAYAMAMNAHILKIIGECEPYIRKDAIPERYLGIDFCDVISENRLDETFSYFLKKHEVENVTIIGKNFANFDLNFLKNIGFGNFTKYHRRILDVGSLFYNHKIDEHVPDLKECLRRAGIEKEIEHTSIADALDVLKCLRFTFQ